MATTANEFRAGADQARSIIQTRKAMEILEDWNDKQIAHGHLTTQEIEFGLARLANQED